jgi:hypothetical protein
MRPLAAALCASRGDFVSGWRAAHARAAHRRPGGRIASHPGRRRFHRIPGHPRLPAPGHPRARLSRRSHPHQGHHLQPIPDRPPLGRPSLPLAVGDRSGGRAHLQALRGHHGPAHGKIRRPDPSRRIPALLRRARNLPVSRGHCRGRGRELRKLLPGLRCAGRSGARGRLRGRFRPRRRCLRGRAGKDGRPGRARSRLDLVPRAPDGRLRGWTSTWWTCRTRP